MLGMQMRRKTYWLGMHGPSIPQPPATLIQDLSEMACGGSSSLHYKFEFMGY